MDTEPLDHFFLFGRMGSTVRAQAQGSVKLIVQPMNPKGAYIPSRCREAGGSALSLGELEVCVGVQCRDLSVCHGKECQKDQMGQNITN